MAYNNEQIRILTKTDEYAIERLLRTSEYIYQRFTATELPLLLTRYPAVGAFSGSSLYSFLLSQTLNAPSAWLGGFGISWTESRSYIGLLTSLLEALEEQLRRRGVRYLHYSGNDIEHDWLRTVLIKQNFLPFRNLYAYDKYDMAIPTAGNLAVTLRPVNLRSTSEQPLGDMPALLRLEELCFEDLWRYDATAFQDIAATHPYFVVVEWEGKVVGYQFNALDDEFGYLIRIAVDPAFERKGIGARLMAEAIRFFERSRVSRIMLNTQEDNYHAHRLYEWFGFIRLQPMGFVMRKYL
ncbi:GNAT family N-acetyltransferase [Tengunoibacter tsumagoiensis]|uniref:N-acetyltransferase n=1 Tax=Tengunoibacter tsumagoiensis TaxID=2014871 RepID=A0A401ZZA1_9CHLR|nr:GNAT family N-acetyltransferase [Tengunoibacter tsumagoiensis]GCE12166.1 N-acetyltransferase [Tengunoibacter tsumagoiensis]